MDPVVTCVHCGAKLKLRKAMASLLSEVRCAKCQKKTPVKPEKTGDKGHAATPDTTKAPAQAEDKQKPAADKQAAKPAPGPAGASSKPDKAADKKEEATSDAPAKPAPPAAKKDDDKKTPPADHGKVKPAAPPEPPKPAAAPASSAPAPRDTGTKVDKVATRLDTHAQDLTSLKKGLRSYYESELQAARKRVSELETRLKDLD